MRQHFFCAKNIENYRAVYRNEVMKQKPSNESFENFEQRIFYSFVKTLFKLPQEVLESKIIGETGIEGLRLDFNFGLRLDIPAGNFRVVIGDADTGETFFDKYVSGGRLISVEQYFIRWQIEIFRDDEKVFEHTLNLEGQQVMFAFLHCGLGDLIALLSFVREFKERNRCKLMLCLPDYMSEFVAHLYPEIPQVDKVTFKTYATYYLAMVMSKCLNVPVDTRNMPLERVGGSILGLGTLPAKPNFKPTMPRICSEPYVCIGVQASTPRKGWLYPGGWDIVVDYLKRLGYRVFCIDKKKIQQEGDYSIEMPANAEDFTGDISIMERANMLCHAEFFIGLGSGLSWLANAVNCPVVMICNFSQDWFEFYTPYRVANRLVCNGCFNDVRVNFLSGCPYHKGTPRELECQKKIFPRQVLNAIERLILDKNLVLPFIK